MVKGAVFKQWINNGYNYGKGSSVLTMDQQRV